MDTSKVTRVEIIDHTGDSNSEDYGRVYVKWNKNIKVEVHLQDDDRTLKVFVKKK